VKRDSTSFGFLIGNFGSKTIRFLAISTILFALCSSARAQQPAKLPRIGYLSAFDATREFGRAQIIPLALRELGYLDIWKVRISKLSTDMRRGRMIGFLGLRPSWCV
jgi:hypothetical protein